MRKRNFFIFTLLMTFTGWNVLHAQVSLMISDFSGCDTLSTQAFITPSSSYDTISSIEWVLNEETLNTKRDTLSLQLTGPGKYHVKALVNNLYEISNSQAITVYTSPNADFKWTDTTNVNEYHYFFSSFPQEPDSLSYSYEWRINNNLQGNLPLFSYTFTETGINQVNLLVSNSAGCSSSQLQNIRISELLQCPNVFTPNMDTHNDVFLVKTDGISVYKFTVFSRAGIKVFYSESPSISWDGRSLSGIEMQPGIYYYTIEQTTPGETDLKSGFVHLIR